MKSDWIAIAFGVLVSTVLAGTLVIAGLKAGITPGVSPLVILCAWGGLSAWWNPENGSRFLNLAQVAGSAGMAVTAGVIFTAPLVQILYKDKGLEVPPVDVPTLILMSLAGALIGFGFVGLATRKFLTDPTLPAPEARACEAMIDAAVTERQARPRLGGSLLLGLIMSFLAPLVVKLGLAAEHIVLAKKTIQLEGDNDPRRFQLDLPFSPIYLGIGGLLTLATALLVAGGSFVRLLGDMMLTQVTATNAATFPANSMRWVGGGAMTIAVGYSLVRFFGARLNSYEGFDQSLLRIDEGKRRFLIGSIIFGTLILVGWLFYQDGPTVFGLSISAAVLIMVGLMVTLGAILSLQIGSSASPVSGTVFVTTLVLCLVALAVGRTKPEDVLLLTPLIVGACVAVCTANDSSQDYKTMQFCRVRIQDGFTAQVLGLIGGCIVVPIALYVAHEAYTLGSDQLTAPQGQMFATLVDGLLLNAALPWAPICIGLAIGAFAVGIDIFAGKKGIQLPSMAFAVGIYLPAYLGVGILIGALCRWFGERSTGKQRPESILAAAGLITGAAALELILGGWIIGGGELQKLEVFELTKEPILWGVTWGDALGMVGILMIGWLLWRNSKPRGGSPYQPTSRG